MRSSVNSSPRLPPPSGSPRVDSQAISAQARKHEATNSATMHPTSSPRLPSLDPSIPSAMSHQHCPVADLAFHSEKQAVPSRTFSKRENLRGPVLAPLIHAAPLNRQCLNLSQKDQTRHTEDAEGASSSEGDSDTASCYCSAGEQLMEDNVQLLIARSLQNYSEHSPYKASNSSGNSLKSPRRRKGPNSPRKLLSKDGNDELGPSQNVEAPRRNEPPTLQGSALRKKKKRANSVRDYLRYTPEEEIPFPVSPNQPSSGRLLLQNTSSNSAVAFKVKTTAPNRYQIKPPMGIIGPLCQFAIEFIIPATETEALLFPIGSRGTTTKGLIPSLYGKDKFLVQSAILEEQDFGAESKQKTLNSVWMTTRWKNKTVERKFKSKHFQQVVVSDDSDSSEGDGRKIETTKVMAERELQREPRKRMANQPLGPSTANLDRVGCGSLPGTDGLFNTMTSPHGPSPAANGIAWASIAETRESSLKPKHAAQPTNQPNRIIGDKEPGRQEATSSWKREALSSEAIQSPEESSRKLANTMEKLVSWLCYSYETANRDHIGVTALPRVVGEVRDFLSSLSSGTPLEFFKARDVANFPEMVLSPERCAATLEAVIQSLKNILSAFLADLAGGEVAIELFGQQGLLLVRERNVLSIDRGLKKVIDLMHRRRPKNNQETPGGNRRKQRNRRQSDRVVESMPHNDGKSIERSQTLPKKDYARHGTGSRRRSRKESSRSRGLESAEEEDEGSSSGMFNDDGSSTSSSRQRYLGSPRRRRRDSRLGGKHEPGGEEGSSDNSCPTQREKPKAYAKVTKPNLVFRAIALDWLLDARNYLYRDTKRIGKEHDGPTVIEDATSGKLKQNEGESSSTSTNWLRALSLYRAECQEALSLGLCGMTLLAFVQLILSSEEELASIWDAVEINCRLRLEESKCNIQLLRDTEALTIPSPSSARSNSTNGSSSSSGPASVSVLDINREELSLLVENKEHIDVNSHENVLQSALKDEKEQKTRLEEVLRKRQRIGKKAQSTTTLLAEAFLALDDISESVTATLFGLQKFSGESIRTLASERGLLEFPPMTVVAVNDARRSYHLGFPLVDVDKESLLSSCRLHGTEPGVSPPPDVGKKETEEVPPITDLSGSRVCAPYVETTVSACATPLLTVKALAAYEAIDDSELPLLEGDLLTVRTQDPSGWWYGTNNGTGRSGWFPSTFVQVAYDLWTIMETGTPRSEDWDDQTPRR